MAKGYKFMYAGWRNKYHMLVIRQVWSKSVSVANTVSTVLCTYCSYLVGVLYVDMSSYHLYKGLLST